MRNIEIVYIEKYLDLLTKEAERSGMLYNIAITL